MNMYATPDFSGKIRFSFSKRIFCDYLIKYQAKAFLKCPIFEGGRISGGHKWSRLMRVNYLSCKQAADCIVDTSLFAHQFQFGADSEQRFGEYQLDLSGVYALGTCTDVKTIGVFSKYKNGIGREPTV